MDESAVLSEQQKENNAPIKKIHLPPYATLDVPDAALINKWLTTATTNQTARYFQVLVTLFAYHPKVPST